MLRKLLFLLFLCSPVIGHAQSQRVVDVASRTGVTQRFQLLQPEQPVSAKAVVILFAGGHGGIQMAPDGSMKELRGNFLVRSRNL